jgi:hypothetical protein
MALKSGIHYWRAKPHQYGSYSASAAGVAGVRVPGRYWAGCRTVPLANIRLRPQAAIRRSELAKRSFNEESMCTDIEGAVQFDSFMQIQ